MSAGTWSRSPTTAEWLWCQRGLCPLQPLGAFVTLCPHHSARSQGCEPGELNVAQTEPSPPIREAIDWFFAWRDDVCTRRSGNRHGSRGYGHDPDATTPGVRECQG